MKVYMRYIIFAVCVLSALFGVSNRAYAQIITVKGNVTDVDNNPIVGATVVIVGNSVSGAITDMDGNYQINAKSGDRLLVSFIGYTDAEVAVNSSATVYDVVLTQDNNILEEVVVLGYGTVKKKDLTGSIEFISGEDVVKSMAINPAEALNGRISGVVVSKTSNRPGASMSMQIRGKNSFNYSNEPLYVIDGVPSTDGMQRVNAEDIESIDVLKDASSCAIYGSRGSNGVVIITTKGATNKEGFVISYNGSVGLKTATRIPDMLGSEGNGLEYVDFRVEQWTNKMGSSSLSTEAFLTDDERRRIKNGEYYDWLREFAQDAITTNHSLSASGSTEKSSYTMGVGYTSDGGLAGSESYDRLTANIGAEYRLADKVRVGMSTYVTDSETNHGSSDALLNAYLIAPIVSLYESDGVTQTFTNRAGGRVNPFVQDANTKNITEAWSVNASAFLAYDPVKNLTLKSQIAAQYDGSIYGYWTGTYSQYGLGVNDPYASRADYYNQNIVWDNTVTYDNVINEKHNLNIIGLFSVQQDQHRYSAMTGEGLPYDSDWHAIQTAEQITNVSSSYWESAMVSYMSRANYVYDDRYLFTLAARYDGTSRLSEKNRWGLLPSAAIGWSVKNEAFLEDVDWVDALKFRVSWGKTGNNNVGYNVTQTVLGLNPYVMGDSGVKGFGLNGSLT